MDAILAPEKLDAFGAIAWTWAVAFLPRLAAAAAIVIFGAYVARWSSNLTIDVVERTGRADRTIEPIIRTSIRYGILTLVIVVALSQLGVQTASLLAVLGAAGLAIGLAIQGTLTNVAAGVMLIWLRPFQVGDYIEVIAGNPLAGTVKEIGLFACLIQSAEGPVIFAPNSTIWNFALRNHSGAGGRLVSFAVNLPEKADLEKAKAILLETMAGDGRALKNPPPDVFIDPLDGGGFSLTCRLRATPADVAAVQRSMIAQVQHRLAAEPPEAP